MTEQFLTAHELLRREQRGSPSAPRRVGLAVALLAAAFASASAAGAGLDEIAEALDASGPAFESAVDAADAMLPGLTPTIHNSMPIP